MTRQRYPEPECPLTATDFPRLRPRWARSRHQTDCRRTSANHLLSHVDYARWRPAMGQRATGGIKRCAAVAGPATDLSCAAKNRVTEVTWLPALELQHFRGFRAAVGVTHA